MDSFDDQFKRNTLRDLNLLNTDARFLGAKNLYKTHFKAIELLIKDKNPRNSLEDVINLDIRLNKLILSNRMFFQQINTGIAAGIINESSLF